MKHVDIEEFRFPANDMNKLLSSFITKVAHAFGRESIALTNTDLVQETHPDAETVKLPDFIRRLIRAPFKDALKEINNDVVLKADYIADGAIIEAFDNVLSEVRKHHKNVLINSEASLISKGKSAMTLRELQKGQLLVGCPKLHSPLALGGHFVHASVPSGFSSYDWSWVSEAGRFFKKHTHCERKHDFTLPLATSQGLLLKGEKETLQVRTFAKALLSSLALDLKTMKNYLSWVSEADQLFAKRGYVSPASAFFIGIRRQQARKAEPVCDRYSGELIGESSAYQGRIRPICPSPEMIKVLLKSISEGLKKALFEHTESCSVDISKIRNTLWEITDLTLQHGLFSQEEEDLYGKMQVNKWLTFYDLGQFDTTQHEGFFTQVYVPFLRNAFDNFDDIEYPMTYFSDLLFPVSTHGDEILRQRVEARSTMSGQPDVTVKNNVVHLIAMSQAIGVITKRKPLDVFKDIIEGKTIKTKIHGDDTMLYFSDNPKDYLEYKRVMESFGLKIDFELGPVYLKKTIPEQFSCDGTKFYNKFKEIVSNKESDEEFSTILYGQSKTLAPIVGSILKNRFGEYSTPSTLLLKISLLDTSLLLEGEPLWNELISLLWDLLWNIFGKSELVLEHHDTVAEAKVSDGSAQVLREQIVKGVLELTKGNSLIAVQAREYLERLFYTNFQNEALMSSEEMIGIYGSLEYNPSTEAASFGIQEMSMQQKSRLVLVIQDELIKSDGRWPSFDDLMFLKQNIMKYHSDK
jgi:hypothetical protein